MEACADIYTELSVTGVNHHSHDLFDDGKLHFYFHVDM